MLTGAHKLKEKTEKKEMRGKKKRKKEGKERKEKQRMARYFGRNRFSASKVAGISYNQP